MDKLWTNKYAPKTSQEVVGQEAIVREILHFVRDYANAKKKALLIDGPPGCGKTSSIYAIAREANLEILEINASDQRNKDQIEQIIGNALSTRSFFSEGKILLIDEVDGIAGNEDRGGIVTLAALIEKSIYPIIMTCNDPSEKKFSPLKKASRILSFEKLKTADIVAILRKIVDAEHVSCDEAVLKRIAHFTNGDVRGAINDLQALCEGKAKITLEDLPALGEREYQETIQEALLKIFKHSDVQVVSSAFDHVKEDLDESLLWLEENIPSEYKRPGELFRAFNALSLADVYKGRIRKRQYWRLLVYINLFLTVGVSSAKMKKYDEVVEYKQTMRLLKIWQANMSNMRKKSVAQKLAVYCHVSSRRALHDIVPYFKLYAKAQQTKMKPLFERLHLSEDDVDWILTK